MLVLKNVKIKNFISSNIVNILLLCIVFSATKNFIFTNNYLRGVLVDYSILKITPIHLLIVPFIIIYFKDLLKNRHTLSYLTLFIFINICFSINPIFSFNYFINFFPFLLIIIVFIKKDTFNISDRLFVVVNILYLLIFLIQFINRQNVFPYFPMGFYSYLGITPNIDFFSFFGEKYVLPLGNFPHSNLFAAFLSFLNIRNLNKKNYFLFLINIFIITILSSFAALVFNFIILVPIIKKGFLKYMLIAVFILLFYFYYIFGFKEVSVAERFNQFGILVYSIKNYLSFGVGLGSFIPLVNIVEVADKRIYVLQPIHNIFLLMLAEGGLFLTTPILYLIFRFKKYFYYSSYLVFIIIFGMFDHFLITLYQGFLLLALTIFLHKSIINNNV